MARKSRIHYPGAFYHVILRGNSKQDVFFDEEDRCRFYLLLQEGAERFQHRIHAFCLMANHIHLVMQVYRIPLSRIMQNLSFRYTRWVNWRHHRCGHLFQGRYKAILLDSDAYLLELVRYIHLNPVRARLVPSPEGYPWSGHSAYCGKEVLPWLCTDTALEMLARPKAAAVRAYRAFVDDAIGEERRSDYHGEGTADSRILGDADFLQKLEGKARPAGTVSTICVADVVSAVCSRNGIEPTLFALRGKSRVGSTARAMAAWIVEDLPSCSLTELGRLCGRDVSSLSAAAQRLRVQSVSDPSLQIEKKELLSQITKCKA